MSYKQELTFAGDLRQSETVAPAPTFQSCQSTGRRVLITSGKFSGFGGTIIARKGPARVRVALESLDTIGLFVELDENVLEWIE